MWNSIKETWWLLPSASALALVLAFHPFNLWPLCFVALVPLYYFVASAPNRPLRQVFLGGFVTGGVFALSLSYFTVIQFRWIPEAHLFSDIVHFGFIPIGLLGGLLCGVFCTLAYRMLRSRSVLCNILAGAAAYTLGEIVLYAACGGYYFAMLGYAAAPLPFFVGFAPIGGAFLVSFVVALINSAIAEGLVALPHNAVRYGAAVGVLAAVLVGAYALDTRYLNSAMPSLGQFSVVSIQDSSRDSVGFGTEQGGVFVFPALAERIIAAAAGAPDLLIYPFSPVEGALYAGEKPSFNKNILVASRDAFVAWTKPLAPASTMLMVWTTLYKDAKFYNVFEYLQGGVLVAEYRKRDLFPFIDYTPQWAQKLGFYTTQIDMTAGESGTVLIGGISASALLCSEIHQQDLSRGDARNSLLLVSSGSEAIFVDGVASEYSLKAAQFRAAESNLPAVRANVLGPSAIINRDGSVVSRLDRGQSGTLRGSIELQAPHITLYSIWGNSGVSVLVFGVLVGAFAVRARTRYNIEHD